MELIAMTKNDPFLQQLIKMITDRLDDMGKKVDANTKATQQVVDGLQATDNVVKEHARAIKSLERKKGKRLELSPSVIYLIAFGAVILLLIVAQLLHVNLGGLGK